jgi:hypothetical protein
MPRVWKVLGYDNVVETAQHATEHFQQTADLLVFLWTKLAGASTA